jgi:pyruvate,orthophosphate dikinase
VGDTDAAEAADDAVVLVRPTTSPDDVSGMIAARAVVTERGGSTSHAAVVSRALGRPSVVGVGEGVTTGLAGREITVDGSAGVVYEGALDTVAVTEADVPGLAELVAWARELSPVAVLDDAPEIVDLHADGVGLDEGAPPDPDVMAERLRGAPAARGPLLATAEGATAVLRSGVPAVVRLPDQHPATLLLPLVQARSPSEEKI